MKDIAPVQTPAAQTGIKVTDSNNNRINLHNLIHIAGGDAQFTKQMLVAFLETTTRGLQEMNEAVNTDQWKAVGELAHKLLPPSRHIGASDLTSLLRKIEESIKNSVDSTTIVTLTKEASGEFQAIRDLLNEEIAKIS
jgi:HPt (histidine-containing phosphotransfer) domain-containing protein